MKASRPYHLLSAIAAAIMCWSPILQADLVVNQDLGALSAGTVNISHNTNLGANNSDLYSSFGSHVYGNEIVLKFTIETRLLLELTSVTLTGDHDFFLLDRLTTATTDAGLRFATGTLGEIWLDFPPETESFGLLEPGTYYISADSYDEIAADFSINLTLSAPDQLDIPSATPLGRIVALATPFSIDTLGSIFDSELGIWDQNGNLIASNDDIDGDTRQSRIDFTELEEGTYYIGLGAYDTVYHPDFIVTATDDDESGSYQLNYPGGSLSGTLNAKEVRLFSFEAGGATPPGTQPLAISEISRGNNGSINITFHSLPGKFYAVDISEDLITWLELDDSVISGGTNTDYTHSTPDLAARNLFYRIREP
ncbi:MAG: hypothetical protein GY899_10270 [Verrucomicrobiaceae bacterium]|nr:hypothetical protein [Verrucomicrobiaceae bacterium]